MKHKQYSISTVMTSTFKTGRIEPDKRVKCLNHVPRGLRNIKEHPRYIWHTYPINGGITAVEVLADNITTNNQLMRAMLNRSIY
jgi:hypothetical protein